MDSALYEGRVIHYRTGTRGEHRFVQRLTWFSLWLDELSELTGLRLFGVNEPAPFALHDQDHGARDGSGWTRSLDRTLVARGLQPGARYQALCIPRIFGYAFNPITVVLAWDLNEQPAAVLYEVHSTFGEAHTYVHSLASKTGAVSFKHSSDKALHVSPFFSMQGKYRFRLSVPGPWFRLGIHYADEDGGRLFAGFSGQRRQLTDRALFAVLLRAPLAAFGVTAGIHWQAFRLWMKGIPIYRKPRGCRSAQSEPADEQSRASRGQAELRAQIKEG